MKSWQYRFKFRAAKNTTNTICQWVYVNYTHTHTRTSHNLVYAVVPLIPIALEKRLKYTKLHVHITVCYTPHNKYSTCCPCIPTCNRVRFHRLFKAVAMIWGEAPSSVHVYHSREPNLQIWWITVQQENMIQNVRFLFRCHETCSHRLGSDSLSFISLRSGVFIAETCSASSIHWRWIVLTALNTSNPDTIED